MVEDAISGKRTVDLVSVSGNMDLEYYTNVLELLLLPAGDRLRIYDRSLPQENGSVRKALKSKRVFGCVGHWCT